MQVDIDRLKELKKRLSEMERSFEYLVESSITDASRAAERTRYYDEPYVVSAYEDVLASVNNIRNANLKLTQQMQAKVRGLDRAISQSGLQGY